MQLTIYKRTSRFTFGEWLCIIYAVKINTDYFLRMLNICLFLLMKLKTAIINPTGMFVDLNWPIGKPLPSNVDEPIAVEYQLHGDRNSDIFRLQRHRKALENREFSSVLWWLCRKNGKTMCLGHTLSLSYNFHLLKQNVNVILCMSG